MVNIGIIVGSVREGRFAEKASDWVVENIKGFNGRAEYTLIDLKDLDLPIFNRPVSPSYDNYEVPLPARVQLFKKLVEGCDGFVFITPEYNHSVPGALKNAIDWLSIPWARKPFMATAYGSTGGSRAIENLVIIGRELNMVVLKEGVYIFNPWLIKSVEELSIYRESFDKGFTSLIEWSELLKEARETIWI